MILAFIHFNSLGCEITATFVFLVIAIMGLRSLNNK